MNRSHWWTLLAIGLLAVATLVALTRQQMNFDDHKRLAKDACELALTNRKLLREVVLIEATEPEHSEQAADIARLQRQVEQIIATTECR